MKGQASRGRDGSRVEGDAEGRGSRGVVIGRDGELGACFVCGAWEVGRGGKGKTGRARGERTRRAGKTGARDQGKGKWGAGEHNKVGLWGVPAGKG